MLALVKAHSVNAWTGASSLLHDLESVVRVPVTRVIWLNQMTAAVCLGRHAKKKPKGLRDRLIAKFEIRRTPIGDTHHSPPMCLNPQ